MKHEPEAPSAWPSPASPRWPLAGSALAQKKYDPGATDTEIKIGNINPYSGPASAYGTIGKAIGAYFKKVNDEGGINGRKIKFITLRRRLQPAQDGGAGAQAGRAGRGAVRSSRPLGTPPNTAIHKYMNDKKVPQLFVATGATKWGDPKNFPWTMGWQPNYQTEGADLRRAHPGEPSRTPRSASSTRTTTTARTT